MKKALLLVNVGTPDAPEKKAVKAYLNEFLNDPLVIDIPQPARSLLVNGIIIPFRVSNSTSLYKRLWTQDGSPLLIYLESLVDQLNRQLDSSFHAFGGMRYGNPSLKSQLETIQQGGFKELVVFPLYPQYATSTTESVRKEIDRLLRQMNYAPKLSFIDQYYDHPEFIARFAEKIQAYNPADYDHVVFSYHGLPNRQVEKLHPGIKLESCTCTIELPEHGSYCYHATVYQTTRLLAKALGLKAERYSVSFQSRLSRNWLKPFTDETLLRLLSEGKKRILIAAPAFTADCLETIIELGHEYAEVFLEAGGEKLQLVESLNDSSDWAASILSIVNDLSNMQ